MEEAAAGVSRSKPPWTVAWIAVAAFIAVLILAAHAGAPYLFKRTTLQDEIAAQIRSSTGFTITTQHARFGLLPRPHVTMAGVHVADPSSNVALDADGMDGDVRLLPLILGRVELATFNLARPQLRVDLDAFPVRPDQSAAWASRASDSKETLQRRLGTVTFVGGSITLTGHARQHPLVFTEVNATVDWRDLDSPATLTGALKVQQTPVDVAGWMAQPSRLMRGQRSTIAFRIHSMPLELTATGDLDGVFFKGHVMASALSLDGLFDLGSAAWPLPAPFASLATSGDATVAFDRDGLTTVDLQNLDFRADGNTYEGTLAYRSGSRPLVTATLATGQLALAPFIAHVPRFVELDRSWNRAPLPTPRIGSLDLDIRISAAHLRLPPLVIDDAALSIMTRGDHLEIGLNEGKAYGGAIKGRMSLGSAPGGLNVRAAGTLADADLATLSWDAVGWQAASGAVSGSANLETTGNSAAELAEHLQGWAKGRSSDGEAFGIDLAAGLRQAALDGSATATPASTNASALAALMTGRTSFSRSAVSLHLKDGTAFVDEATMRTPSASLSFTGSADLANRRLDLHAAIVPASSGTPNAGPSPRLRLDVSGAFSRVLIAPEDAATRPDVPAPGP